MITRDYLLRQIQQMVQVLARVFSLKSNQQHEEAVEVIDQAFRDIPGLEDLFRPDLSRDELLDLCRTEDGFYANKAAALADLLSEKASLLDHKEERKIHFQRSLWLYEAALSQEDVAVRLDIYEHIAWIKEQLGYKNGDDARGG